MGFLKIIRVKEDNVEEDGKRRKSEADQSLGGYRSAFALAVHILLLYVKMGAEICRLITFKMH